MQETSIFDYRDYKVYLGDEFSTDGKNRGKRTLLAKALRCQTAFISHVLNGNSHFSLEHAIQIAQFLKLTQEESHYFVLLVELGRAGSQALKEHFSFQIEEIQKRRSIIKERIVTEHELSPEAQLRYYSSWYFSAIHVATSVTKYQTRNALADCFGLDHAVVNNCLEFLTRHGLVIPHGSRYVIGPTRIHLGADSPMISKLHTNWRLKALQTFENAPETKQGDLHYSTVISLSNSDIQKVRDVLLHAIERTERIYRPSPEEVVYCIGLDWFRVSKEK